jgi:hypothetical protein
MSDSFATFVEAYMNDQRVRNKFEELRAIEALKTSGQLASIQWENLREGDPHKGEPDWIVVGGGDIITSGFEVTKPAFDVNGSSIQKKNALLNDLIRTEGEALASKTGNIDSHAKNAYEIVAGDKLLMKLQKLLVKISVEELAESLISCIENKKSKSYHNQNDYNVHLIIKTEWNYIITDGREGEALAIAGGHDKGNFKAIWHVNDMDKVTRIS